MRKILLILSIASISFLLKSCMDNDNSIVAKSIIDLRAGELPDTVEQYASIPISLRASVPNSCWHSIVIYNEVVKDTIVGFWAKATFENHGEDCIETVETKDTVVNFPIIYKKMYVFHFMESFNKERIDTVVVRARQ